ncbi:hypothetical protein EVAR_20635_1 [Eumeta japonica]|uniref:Uncharacterized protein n=1 Tax=Eumeta variegata TaxID=151549 RepID=A0A4C1VAG5_EUMVA|nr:hypothetical protein EVAR_20635_1 [Eumeta japonica]
MNVNSPSSALARSQTTATTAPLAVTCLSQVPHAQRRALPLMAMSVIHTREDHEGLLRPPQLHDARQKDDSTSPLSAYGPVGYDPVLGIMGTHMKRPTPENHTLL